MPTIFNPLRLIQLNGASDNGSSLTWTSETDLSFMTTIQDVNDDGNLDSGLDYYHTPTQVYSGFTVEINGHDYAIFREPADSTIFYVPYDNTFDPLAFALPLSMKSTSTKNENGTAQNFCFLTGTMIATTNGERAVETLKIGDLIRTADGRDVPMKWLGRQVMKSAFANVAMDDRLAPVCIAAGTLGNHSDLYVSADHGMLIDGYVINASALVNDRSIRFVPASEMPPEFTYYHIETEAHDVILANGAASETFVDAACRATFDNHQEYLDLYGVERVIPEMDFPRISAQRLLPVGIRQRLGLTNDTDGLAATA